MLLAQGSKTASQGYSSFPRSAWERIPGFSSVHLKHGNHGPESDLITEANQPYFMNCTVVEWLVVFTHPQTVQIILENHQDCIAQAPELKKCVAGFKAYAARQIIDHL